MFILHFPRSLWHNHRALLLSTVCGIAVLSAVLVFGSVFLPCPPPCHGPGSHLDRKALFHVLGGTHSTRAEFLCSHPKAIGGCYCIPLTEKKNINKKKCQPHWLSMHSFSSITEGHCLGLLQHHCLLS